MATPVSNDINSNSTNEFADSEVHVMPEKFLTPKTVGKSKIGTWLVIGLVVIAVIGISIAVYFWLQAPKNSNPPVENNNPAQPTAPATTTPQTPTNPPINQATPGERDQQRLQAISQLQLALQRYFLQTTAYPRTLDLLQPDFINQIPVDPTTNQPYLYTANGESFQISFVLEEGAPWGVTVLPKGKYLANATSIVPEGEQLPTTPTAPTPPDQNQDNNSNNPIPPTIGKDTDNDGLTDIEEAVYHTSPTNPQTTASGYLDGAEVINAYDPSFKNRRIWQAPTMSVFRNPSFGYSVVYPKVFDLRNTTGGQEVIFTSTTTNEFIDVLVEDNPLAQSAITWYLRQNPNANVNTLTPLNVGSANVPAIQTADGLVTYISVGTKLYIVSYNIGVGKEANFFATYKMFLKTLQFSTPTNSTSSGSTAGNQTASSTPSS